MKADKEVVLAALMQDGHALQHASEELRADRALVLQTVNHTGDALKYAAEELKVDKEFILQAVQQDGLALQYAKDKLKEDIEVVNAAVTQNNKAQVFALLKEDKEAEHKAGKQDRTQEPSHQVPKTRRKQNLIIRFWNKIKALFKSLISMVKRAFKLSSIKKHKEGTTAHSVKPKENLLREDHAQMKVDDTKPAESVHTNGMNK